jgi:hypothetical protein
MPVRNATTGSNFRTTTTVGGAGTVSGPQSGGSNSVEGGTVPSGGGNAVNARKVAIGGLGAARNDASGTTNRFSRDPSFDTYAANGGDRVARGFIKCAAEPIAGGARLHVESFHGNHNDSLTLFLLAEVLDTKTNQMRTVTLSVLAQNENLNGATYRGNTYFDISYDDVNKWLQARNPALKITPGVTNLGVAARWSNGHQAGGFGRGGVFRLPPAANATSAVNVRVANATSATTDEADLPLDMQVNYPPQLIQAVPKLAPNGAIVSRLESELKGCTTKDEMIAGVRQAYALAELAHAGKKGDVERALGKDWTIAPVNRYWLKDDGSANQQGKPGAGLFKGFRVDDRGWPLQDPMHDTYMDDANLGMTRKEGAIRLRKNKQATEVNVKPGGGRRDDRTQITQRIEYALKLLAEANVPDASLALQQLSSNSQWSGTVFNQAQREVRKLDPNLNLAQALVPWLEVTQERHKFTVKNEKTGVEVELSLDFVKAKTTRPQHANPDGTPREVEFYVLEAELDHLQLQSANQATFVAPSAVGMAHFSTDAEQDGWLKTTSPSVTMDIDPRLHELKDLENASFRKTSSYKAFESVSDKMLRSLFPNGLDSGRQKAAYAAELLALVGFSDDQLRAAAKDVVEAAGFTFAQPVQQAIDFAIKNDPAKRQLLEQGLANGTARNVSQWLQQLAGFPVALEYDAKRLKELVEGRLQQLGLSVDAAALAMLDGATTQRLPAQNLTNALQQMQNVNDAQALQGIASALGVSPAPVPKVDVQRLLDGAQWGRSVIASNLEAASIDARHAPQVVGFIEKALGAGMTAFEARSLIASLGSNPQQRLDQIGQQRQLQADVPKLRASPERLAAQAQQNLRAWYFDVDDALKGFLKTIAETRTPQEALNFVATLRNNPETVIQQEARRLGVTPPAIAYDWQTIDGALEPSLTQQGVAYGDEMKKLVRTAVGAGVPVGSLQSAFAYLSQMPLAQALRQRGIYLVGVAIPDVKYDAAATEQRVRAALNGYGQAIPQTNEVTKFVEACLAAGMSPNQVQNYASWSAQYGRDYAVQQLGSSGVNASALPPLPIDVNGFVTTLSSRWGAQWTQPIDTFVRAEMAKALASSGTNTGLASFWSQQPRQVAVLVSQRAGVPLPSGI